MSHSTPENSTGAILCSALAVLVAVQRGFGRFMFV